MEAPTIATATPRTPIPIPTIARTRSCPDRLPRSLNCSDAINAPPTAPKAATSHFAASRIVVIADVTGSFVDPLELSAESAIVLTLHQQMQHHGLARDDQTREIQRVSRTRQHARLFRRFDPHSHPTHWCR